MKLDELSVSKNDQISVYEQPCPGEEMGEAGAQPDEEESPQRAMPPAELVEG